MASPTSSRAMLRNIRVDPVHRSRSDGQVVRMFLTGWENGLDQLPLKPTLASQFQYSRHERRSYARARMVVGKRPWRLKACGSGCTGRCDQ